MPLVTYQSQENDIMVKVIAGDEDKAQAKRVYDLVKTKATWDALTQAQKNESIRRFMKYLLKITFAE